MSNITSNKEIQALSKLETHDLYTNFKGELRTVSKGPSLTRFVIDVVHGINTDKVVLRTIAVLNKNLNELQVNGQYADLKKTGIDSLRAKLLPKQRNRLVDDLTVTDQKIIFSFENKLKKLQEKINTNNGRFEDLQTELSQLNRNYKLHNEKLNLKPNETFTTALNNTQNTLNIHKSIAKVEELINKNEISHEEIKELASKHTLPEMMSITEKVREELKTKDVNDRFELSPKLNKLENRLLEHYAAQ